MKTIIQLLSCTFLLFSCASVKTQKISDELAKSENCKLDVFNTENDIKRKYKIICLLDSKTGNSIWNKRTGEAAIELAKKEACKCGSDAIIITSSGQTKLKFYSYKRGISSLKAVKYL
jgi:hypothetical protein